MYLVDKRTYFTICHEITSPFSFCVCPQQLLWNFPPQGLFPIRAAISFTELEIELETLSNVA